MLPLYRNNWVVNFDLLDLGLFILCMVVSFLEITGKTMAVLVQPVTRYFVHRLYCNALGSMNVFLCADLFSMSPYACMYLLTIHM